MLTFIVSYPFININIAKYIHVNSSNELSTLVSAKV